MKTRRFWGGIGGLFVVASSWYWYRYDSRSFDTTHTAQVWIEYGMGTWEQLFTVQGSSTVREAVEQAGFVLSDNDAVWPARDEEVVSGTHIRIMPAHKVTLIVEGTEQEIHTTETTVVAVLDEAHVEVGENDLVMPAPDALVGERIEVVRVVVKEETEEEEIPFKTEVREDAGLSFRTTKVVEDGVVGRKVTRYQVSYHNGDEVARKVLEEVVTQEPKPEVVAQGTKVTVKKKHEGAASWYSHTGTLAAANPWMPIGSYARVTNTANGQSVIVRINDRGPFVPGRIIDLDRVAFTKIASIGAGVIHVKVEEIE